MRASHNLRIQMGHSIRIWIYTLLCYKICLNRLRFFFALLYTICYHFAAFSHSFFRIRFMFFYQANTPHSRFERVFMFLFAIKHEMQITNFLCICLSCIHCTHCTQASSADLLLSNSDIHPRVIYQVNKNNVFKCCIKICFEFYGNPWAFTASLKYVDKIVMWISIKCLGKMEWVFLMQVENVWKK